MESELRILQIRLRADVESRALCQQCAENAVDSRVRAGAWEAEKHFRRQIDRRGREIARALQEAEHA